MFRFRFRRCSTCARILPLMMARCDDALRKPGYVVEARRNAMRCSTWPLAVCTARNALQGS